MKALFFGVCLLNVLFFFWEFHAGALTPPLESPSSLPSLLLVNERETARRGAEISAYLDRAATELQTKQAVDILHGVKTFKALFMQPKDVPGIKPAIASRQQNQSQPNKCYEAGPFSDQADLARWAKDQHLKAFKPIFKESAISSDFQVYYPAAKDAEQTRINTLMLKAKGFADVWPVTDGELKGAVSLGVFNDRQRASVFKTQLAERGVKAEIRQRTTTRAELFIRFTAVPAALQNISHTRLSAADCRNVLN